jgi:large conductance mechanosensitive channel
MRTTLNDFKKFLLRGNVVDLAVAVVVGAAFSGVVSALVEDLITPLISIPGKADFGRLTFTVHGSIFRYGHFLNALFSFMTVAAAVFFFVVKPVTHLMSMRKTKLDDAEETKTCSQCLSKVPAAALRCAFCTSVLEPEVSEVS